MKERPEAERQETELKQVRGREEPGVVGRVSGLLSPRSASSTERRPTGRERQVAWFL